MPILVEINTIFVAANQEEAEELLDRIMDAELDIVCPSDKSRLNVCSHCHGSLKNPDEDEDEENTAWKPGNPCAVCAAGDHPGYEMSCAREHSAGATIHPDDNWLTGEDRRRKALLTKLLDTLEGGGPQSAKALIEEEITAITYIDTTSEEKNPSLD